MSKEMVRTIKNFAPQEHIDFWKEYIDETLPKARVLTPNRRWALAFGKDKYFDWSHHNLDEIGDIREMVLEYFDAISDAVRDLYSNENPLYVCSFWLAKQQPGGNVGGHIDTDEESNTHFKYSAVLYLTDNTKDGQLTFPYINHTVSASAGELAVFPSAGTDYFHEVKQIRHERYSLCFWFTEDESFAITN
jgi:hypothetical protein